ERALLARLDQHVQPGEMITLDFGAMYKGYCADMTRTVSLGEPTAKMKEIYDIVLEAQMACQDALAPGKICRDVDAISRKMIGDAGYGEYFGHGLGHAVGIDIHENPRLSPRCGDTLRPGHVMTVEPGIYLPGTGGVRIENTCLITEGGARSLVAASRELRVL
ncbi:MAG TPA: M24 family metallopeptidase, partial [Clostridia bacterium]|nr:M24 family metallopeptidase [Clostridia bacterium]